METNLEIYRQRYLSTLELIRECCKSCGRSPESVELLPVSKSQPLQSLEAFLELGVTNFGENYAQELAKKAAHFGTRARFVFIGTLQSNKIKQIVKNASEIQTVTSLRYAELIARQIDTSQMPYPIFLCVNAGDETSKSGIAMAEAQKLSDAIGKISELDLQGLMAIPPPLTNFCSSENLSDPNFIPSLYQELSSLAKTIGKGKLSLGMSQDLRPAILAGSNCVRVGTALFGPRG